MLLLSAEFYQIFFFLNYFSNTIRVSNSLDPDQDQRCVGRDLDPNCLQRLSAYMGLDGRKPVFEGLLTTKAQTSLRIWAV